MRGPHRKLMYQLTTLSKTTRPLYRKSTIRRSSRPWMNTLMSFDSSGSISDLTKCVTKKREHAITSPPQSIPFNGINFIKTWIWSDNNHLTRKSYYDEMFKLFHDKRGRGNNPRFMEWFMRDEGERNCTYWGTF
jgi:hypothetical protein